MSAPDYYKILDIPPKATQQQIRDAYKKAALKHHPDRVPAESPERASRTKRFQQINDAYYTLCDPARRREYDAARTYNNYTGGFDDSEPEEEIPRPQGQQGTTPGGFPWSSFFGGSTSSSDNNGGASTENERERFSNEQFGNVFEEMLREEGMAEGEQAQPTGKFWSLVGGLSGGAMGFIIANFPGAVAGAVAGNRLGAVRDARGKSVYAVFQELPQADKARMLSDLASKVFAHAVSS
ncbi:Heat shock protein DnaJ [Botryosphaeria dothidea]|uniref:Heat shock protein DnaJ n=1 Tax=Botryosphaeria dothidea TaxID=55169 RepID=A0A8H4IYV5_9PEZI|nr:Heat shock protein DnaJ [Botryosphaeria dothidea]KAF4312137.1 Heat shock protein DnaJ [Botryosphaeria dothidea]